MNDYDFDFPIKLEIGPGTKPRPGFVHLDVRELPDVEIVSKAYAIPLPDGSVEEIWSVDCFEHLSFAEARLALKEWHRLLIPGGVVRFTCPDVYEWAKFLVQAEESESGQGGGWAMDWIMTAFWGWQQHPADFHRSGWTPKTLTRAMAEAGFVGIRSWQTWWYNGPNDRHLCFEGKKA
jgi:predicted SAM-dependent methyltransferase